MFDSDRAGNFEIFSATAAGGDVQQLTHDPRYDTWWPRLSPDRQHLLFYRTPLGMHDRDYSQTTLWMANADGSNAVALRPPGTDGWQQQGHAEWSPDGSRLVMFGGSKLNPQIFVTDADGRHPRAVVKRPGTNLDPSFSPDGHTIVFIGCPHAVCLPADYEVYTVAAGGGDATRVTDDHERDQDPAFSPDGRQLAFLTAIDKSRSIWDIRVAGADGSGVHRLLDDNAVNSRPEWSRDGRTILFHRVPPGKQRFQLFSVRPDGSGLTEMAGNAPGNNEYPGT